MTGVQTCALPIWQEEAQARIKIARRNINNLRYADDTTLMAESKEEIKSLLIKVKEEREQAGLKLSIKIRTTMASSPITSWQIDGETVETVTNFIFLGSKVTADGDCRHKIKKTYDKPGQHIKKQRLYFVNTVYIVKSIGFPVVMYGCESWTINKAEH